jgi:transposase
VRPDRHRDAELRGTLIALRALARRVQALTAEERELKRQIEALVAQLAQALLDEPGVGPIAAAQVLISWSHHGRFRSEAAFARLAGAAPIPASSGRVRRHRLDPAATGSSTARCTRSSSAAARTTRRRSATSSADPRG